MSAHNKGKAHPTSYGKRLWIRTSSNNRFFGVAIHKGQTGKEWVEISIDDRQERRASRYRATSPDEANLFWDKLVSMGVASGTPLHARQ